MADLDNLFSKKVAGIPLPIIMVGGVAVGWYLYKQHKAKTANGTAGPGGDSLSSPASGNFKGDYTLTQDGQTSNYSSSGPLFSAGGVGFPVGYPGSTTGGDVYVNVPQTTSQSATAQTYPVQTGDTLQKIAQKLWGNSRLWRMLYAANTTTIGGNPNSLAPGTVLTVPTVDASVLASPGNNHGGCGGSCKECREGKCCQGRKCGHPGLARYKSGCGGSCDDCRRGKCCQGRKCRHGDRDDRR